MKRLCFLLPDVDTAHGVVDDLRARGIGDADIYAEDDVILDSDSAVIQLGEDQDARTW